MPYLTLMIFLPLLGAVIAMMLPKAQEKLIKNLAIIFSLPSLVISIFLWLSYDDSGEYLAFATEQADWIPAISVQYHMGVDGLSIPLVVLTTLLATLSLRYGRMNSYNNSRS